MDRVAANLNDTFFFRKSREKSHAKSLGGTNIFGGSIRRIRIKKREAGEVVEKRVQGR